MKLLTIITMREAFLTMPASVMRQIYWGFQNNMNKLKEEGKVLDIAFMPGGERWMIISENESIEDLAVMINKIPATGLFHCEVNPLSDFNVSMNSILNNMDEGDAMMPGGTVK